MRRERAKKNENEIDDKNCYMRQRRMAKEALPEQNTYMYINEKKK
jgi:hypothetical protein